MNSIKFRVLIWMFSHVIRLWSGQVFKAVFLLLVITMFLYCYHEQAMVGVFTISGFLRQNKTSIHDDVLPSFLENSTGFVTSGPGSENRKAVKEKESSLVKSREEEVSSTSCVFPHINPFDPEIMKMAGLDRATLACNGPNPDLTYVDDFKLVINKTLLSETNGQRLIRCKYQEIFRTEGDDNKIRFGDFSNHFTDSFDLPEETEFILVICEADLSIQPKADPEANETTTATPEWSVVSKRYYPLVPKLNKLSDIESLLLQKRKEEAAPAETLNVLMIGFDGVSRHQFLRAMNRTYNLLMNGFKSYDMTMYTQVGLNTFPNFLPLLGGKFEDEITAWWNRNQYADAFDMVWTDFKKAGFRTLYTEDTPYIGAFHYQKIGFLSTPTTHFSRPIAVAIERDESTLHNGQQCVGNQPEVLFHAEYLRRFMDTFRGKPWFAMAFHTKLTHDDMTYIKLVDDHVHDFYVSLNASGLLNNTMLISFSDHGQRWGSIRSTFNGIIESRTPYAIITLPVWFLKKYPDVAKNLKTNTARLTTHFDTHATIQDLMYFRARGEIPLSKPKHGLSLFQEIPKNRTCEDIPIPPEYCVCGQQSLSVVDPSSEVSKLLADKVVQVINDKRNPEICAELKLSKIMQIIYMQFSDYILIEKMKKSLFKVRLQTEPGLAIYEATVYADMKQESIVGSILNFLGLSNDTLSNIDVGDSIDRLNFYKGQADCMDDARLKPYCYCKNLPNR